MKRRMTPARAMMWSMVFMLVCTSALSADPLAGRWVLNRGKSHYGPGADPRKQETFNWETVGQGVKCTIRSVRTSGKTLLGGFVAAYDGRAYPATGIPDVDQVRLRRVDDFVADATFSYRGKLVFGYRAVRSDDGRSLTIVSVDPASSTILNSVVVYDRR